MRSWIKSNWASGTRGKRQVVLAGLLFSALLGGGGYITWITQRAPLRYRAVLEGEDGKGHYVTTLAVASSNPWQARRLVLSAAKRQGLQIVGVEEIEATGPAPSPRKPRVLRAPWDKTYYIPEEDEHRH